MKKKKASKEAKYVRVRTQQEQTPLLLCPDRKEYTHDNSVTSLTRRKEYPNIRAGYGISIEEPGKSALVQQKRFLVWCNEHKPNERSAFLWMPLSPPLTPQHPPVPEPARRRRSVKVTPERCHVRAYCGGIQPWRFVVITDRENWIRFRIFIHMQA